MYPIAPSRSFAAVRRRSRRRRAATSRMSGASGRRRAEALPIGRSGSLGQANGEAPPSRSGRRASASARPVMTARGAVVFEEVTPANAPIARRSIGSIPGSRKVAIPSGRSGAGPASRNSSRRGLRAPSRRLGSWHGAGGSRRSRNCGRSGARLEASIVVERAGTGPMVRQTARTRRRAPEPPRVSARMRTSRHEARVSRSRRICRASRRCARCVTADSTRTRPGPAF